MRKAFALLAFSAYLWSCGSEHKTSGSDGATVSDVQEVMAANDHDVPMDSQDSGWNCQLFNSKGRLTQCTYFKRYDPDPTPHCKDANEKLFTGECPTENLVASCHMKNDAEFVQDFTVYIYNNPDIDESLFNELKEAFKAECQSEPGWTKTYKEY